ncbi:response regulator [Pelagibacterium luteolum]|uniref:response regulator n=1 Tax=Pelagibacterium luteolum TaxID=440168 RepID=UPI001FCE1249|nr:response regulator [Pelagibacterium luteolum]
MIGIDMASPNIFHGRRVLVLEDDYWIMAELVRDLRESGADVVGPFGEIIQALDALGSVQNLDAAILDVNIQGNRAFAVADILMDRNIPFVFATGYDASEIPAAYANIPVFQKPVTTSDIAQALLMRVSH